jgi:hypothetical protein
MKDGMIQLLELRRLLYEFKDLQPDVCIRFRLVGEMWQTSFAKVLKLTEEGVILLNERTSIASDIKDLREIVQFELDARYQNYHPHFHYQVQQAVPIVERHASLKR